MADRVHTAEFLVEMQDLLLEKRREILGNINQSEANLRSNEGHHLADVEDLASDAADEETAVEILEIEREELEQIDKALAAVDGGTYGLCEDCNKKISKARLNALPFATMCIKCKRLLESGSRGDDD